jgi:hypothetical protein
MHKHIHDKNPLTAGEYTYNVEPERFVFDFKQITPQFGPGGVDPQVIITHKVVVLDPWMTKMLAQQLTVAVEGYEKEFGEIKQSAAIQKAQQRVRATTVERPSYMG